MAGTLGSSRERIGEGWVLGAELPVEVVIFGVR
jgi:hypothetical protein